MNIHLAKNIVDIYQRHGLAWTAQRGRHLYEKAWLDLFLSYVPAQAEILDIGCATGVPIAEYLIKQKYKVTGVDSSASMLAVARQKFPLHTWLLQDMRQLHLSKPFAGILAWDSFFHLTVEAQREMFARFAQYSQSGTVLMFTSGPEAGEAIGEMFGEPLYHASLSQTEYRILLKKYGFHVLKMQSEDVTCTGHTVWLAQQQI